MKKDDSAAKTWDEIYGDKATETPVQRREFLPDLTDDELRKLAREQLSMALQAIDPIASPEMTRKLCAELMDRLDGKPGQAITMDANIRTITVNATVEFIQPTLENTTITIENDNTLNRIK